MKQRVSVGRNRLVLFAQLHRAGLHGSFVGEQTPAAFTTDPQHTATAIQRILLGIEEAILLEASSAQRRRADREHALPCLVCAREPELDFPFYCHAALIIAKKHKGGPEKDPPLETGEVAEPLFLADRDERLLAIADQQHERGAP
jgi:hypothetical protein